MGEQKFFGTRIRRKEILSPELFDIVQNSIPARQKTAGVGMFPGEATESVRIGKHRLFNKETYVYVDNMGFFPNVWITDKKGEQIAKSIIAELEKRKMKPRLHRGLPEVLQ